MSNLTIPGALYTPVMQLVNDHGYSVEDAIAKAAADAVRTRQERPGRDEGAQAEESPTPDDTGAPGASKSLTVTIPAAPPSALLPNNRNRRGGFHPGTDAAAESREVAKYAAMEHVKGKPIAGDVHLILHVAYGIDPKTRRARNLPDLDATISSCKNMIDGLVEAGLLYDDDQVKLITASHERLEITRKIRPNGYTVMTITEIAS